MASPIDQFRIAGSAIHHAIQTEDRHLNQVPVDRTAQAKANSTTMPAKQLLANYQRLVQAQDRVGHLNQVHTHDMMNHN